MIGVMHRYRGWTGLHGTLFAPAAACSPAHATCPFSLADVGLSSCQSVSSVASVLLAQGFVDSPVPDSTNTRPVDRTFLCFCIFHVPFFF